MTNTTNAGTLFPEELVTEMFSSVSGHSSLARMTGQKPIPFTGQKEFIFSMDGEAALVGEGKAKPAGDAKITPVIIKPVKFVYQHRLSDEFQKSGTQRKLLYLKTFAEGFAAKIARALDIAAIHGVNPATGTKASFYASGCFDGVVTNKIPFSAVTADTNLDDAVALIRASDRMVSGIAMAPSFSAAMSKIQNKSGVEKYPEFRFGANPGSFFGMKCDINNTVSANPATEEEGTVTDMALIGDFEKAFRWGYAAQIPFEVIEYGDPDGTGRDLKQYNEVCLRAEAYIGWGILDKASFALIQNTSSE